MPKHRGQRPPRLANFLLFQLLLPLCLALGLALAIHSWRPELLSTALSSTAGPMVLAAVTFTYVVCVTIRRRYDSRLASTLGVVVLPVGVLALVTAGLLTPQIAYDGGAHSAVPAPSALPEVSPPDDGSHDNGPASTDAAPAASPSTTTGQTHAQKSDAPTSGAASTLPDKNGGVRPDTAQRTGNAARAPSTPPTAKPSRPSGSSGSSNAPPRTVAPAPRGSAATTPRPSARVLDSATIIGADTDVAGQIRLVNTTHGRRLIVDDLRLDTTQRTCTLYAVGTDTPPPAPPLGTVTAIGPRQALDVPATAPRSGPLSVEILCADAVDPVARAELSL